jgi:HKD family nuclease
MRGTGRCRSQEEERMQVIWNTIKDEHKNKLKELFQGALNFECAVAFAKMSGFSDIKKPLEASLKRGMSARLILGLDFYITDPEVLDMLLGWESRYKVKTYVAKSQSNVCFHPKIYAFSYRNHAINSSWIGESHWRGLWKQLGMFPTRAAAEGQRDIGPFANADR